MLENPDEEFDIDANCPDVSEADYLINPSGYREVVWDLKVILLIPRLWERFNEFIYRNVELWVNIPSHCIKYFD